MLIGEGSMKVNFWTWGEILERGLITNPQEIFCIIILSLLLFSPGVRVSFNSIYF